MGAVISGGIAYPLTTGITHRAQGQMRNPLASVIIKADSPAKLPAGQPLDLLSDLPVS